MNNDKTNIRAGTNTALHVDNISKSFKQGNRKIDVLIKASLSLEQGEIVSLAGQSGSGKSTFLHIAGLLESADSGSIKICGKEAIGASDKLRTELRREYIGFVYQFHNLQPEFSALENVMIPQIISGKNKKEAAQRAENLLAGMSLQNRIHHRPAALSGGEQQRVAIARAIANSPKILLADEPTGNLDPKTADKVLAGLMDMARETGTGVLIVTHNMEIAEQTDRVLELNNGRIVGF